MSTAATRRTRANAAPEREGPVVVYVASSLDGTAFALDGVSQLRVRAQFPSVDVSPRRIFISHDTHEAVERSVGRFEEQVAVLLTGVSTNRLIETFGAISFRDPKTEKELGRLPPPKRVTRRA